MVYDWHDSHLKKQNHRLELFVFFSCGGSGILLSATEVMEAGNFWYFSIG